MNLNICAMNCPRKKHCPVSLVNKGSQGSLKDYGKNMGLESVFFRLFITIILLPVLQVF